MDDMVEENVENMMEEPQLVTPETTETTQTSAFAVYTRHFLKWTCLMSRLMQIQTLSLSLKTNHFNTLFSNCFSSFTKKMNFDVECTVFHFQFLLCMCLYEKVDHHGIIISQNAPKCTFLSFKS